MTIHFEVNIDYDIERTDLAILAVQLNALKNAMNALYITLRPEPEVINEPAN